MLSVKLICVLVLALVVSCVAAPKFQRALELAEPCSNETCLLPDCRCSQTFLEDEWLDEIEQIPQLVVLTFDDAVTVDNSFFIEEAINGRLNPDNCSAAATFFISHEFTDYSKVHDHWANGHEIALHSISHNFLQAYWQDATTDVLFEEFGGQRELVSHFANIPFEDIQGMRVPQFQMAGNNSVEALRLAGLTYDSTWQTQEFIEPGLWPYSLDYQSTQSCDVGSCPTASLPGVWISPLLSWVDIEGYFCTMVDTCPYIPVEEDDIYEWMVSNFERIYQSNRAPFGVHMHAAWFAREEKNFNAYKRFLDYMNEQPDVYFVTSSRALEFSRNPRSASEGPFESCEAEKTSTCTPQLCTIIKEITGETMYMTQCGQCPAVYPWLGNPLGVATE